MPFKTNWESPHSHTPIEPATIQAMAALGRPHQKLISHETLGGGCANLNIKLTLSHSAKPLILRIYLRDKSAAEREQALAKLLKPTVLIPEVYYIGDYAGHRFALTEYIPGIPLREVLLTQPEQAWQPLMVQVGKALALLQAQTFDQSGFLTEHLTIRNPLHSNDLINFALNCLQSPQAQSQLPPATLKFIQQLFAANAHLLPNQPPYHLVHGDFDPANILVARDAQSWSITGILDWEFAYAGSWLNDVANMLRYTQQMPPTFEHAFLEGLQQTGAQLPEYYKRITDLYNLSALLDLLTRLPNEDYPKAHKDICELINHIVRSH